MLRDPIPELDILKIFEHIGGQLPANLKTHGWTPVRCPIHGGFSGSINPKAGKYHCFGCDAHGDGYDLLEAAENIPLATAKEMAEEQGWLANTGPVKGPPRRPTAGARRPPARPERRR